MLRLSMTLKRLRMHVSYVAVPLCKLRMDVESTPIN